MYTLFTYTYKIAIGILNTKICYRKMTIITNYKKLNSAYFLSGITIQYTYKEGEKNKNGRMQYVTTRLNATNPEVFQGRMYYEDIETNRDFWENYTVYFQED